MRGKERYNEPHINKRKTHLKKIKNEKMEPSRRNKSERKTKE